MKASLDFVESVERGHLVGFRQGRVIEYRAAEVFHGGAHGHHGLSDVHDFRGSIPDHVHAE